MLTLFITAITLGILGSFHCIGMCGPIALALPLNQNSFLAKLLGILTYNLGRVFTYSLLGGIFGIIGESFVIAGFQQALSITLGALILVIVLLPESVYSRFKITSFIFSCVSKLKQKLRVLFKKSSYSSLFFIGTLNGLLPCGLVYLGIAGAIASGSILSGALFMASFGLGTLPAMMILSIFSNSISLKIRNKITKAVPVVVVAMAVLLIVRGMNLGIPYVSPELSSTKAECHKCCHN